MRATQKKTGKGLGSWGKGAVVRKNKIKPSRASTASTITCDFAIETRPKRLKGCGYNSEFLCDIIKKIKSRDTGGRKL